MDLHLIHCILIYANIIQQNIHSNIAKRPDLKFTIALIKNKWFFVKINLNLIHCILTYANIKNKILQQHCKVAMIEIQLSIDYH